MKRFFRYNNAKKGFTLVELIVVIAIVAILTSVSIAGYYGFMAYANQSAADQEATQFRKEVIAEFSLNYYGKTSQNAGVYGTVNKNGLRLAKSTGDNPSDYATSILAEAFTYAENPAAFQREAVFDFSDFALLKFDGSETDGQTPALLSPKMVKVEDDYFITEVTYQSKNSYKSPVKFTDLEGQEVAPSKPIDMSKTPSALTNVKGLKDSYAANELVDFSNVTATIEFTDGTSAVVGSESLEFEEVSSVSPMHHRSVVGTRTFKVSYRHGANATPIEAPAVQTQKTSAIESVTDIKLPRNIQQYQKTLSISEDSPAGFKKDTSADAGYYFVGKENPFKFVLEALNIDNTGRVIKLDPTSNEIKSLFTYKLINESTEAEETLTYNGGFDFSEKAVGKYVLKAIYSGKELSLKIKLIDAFNVYTAEDLKQFDNTTLRCYDFTTGGTDRVEAFDAQPIYKKYISPFFKPNNNGTDVIETHENDYNSEHNGIVLQNSVKITSNLFDKHVFREDTGEIIRAKGFLEDNAAMHFFRRNLVAGQRFYFEGNYFTIDASTMPKMFLVGDEKGFIPELFSFAHDYGSPEAKTTDLYGNNSWFKAYVERVNIVGNGGKVDDYKTLGSLNIISALNATECDINYVNITKANYALTSYHHSYALNINGCKIVNSFWASLFSSGTGNRAMIARGLYTEGLWFSQDQESQDDITYYPFDENGNMIETPITDSTERLASIDNSAGIHIKNSILKDCGGPSIDLQYSADVTSNDGSWSSFPTVVIDEKTEISSFVTGTEPFFTILHLDTQLQQVDEMNELFKEITNNKLTFDKDNGEKYFINALFSITPSASDELVSQHAYQEKLKPSGYTMFDGSSPIPGLNPQAMNCFVEIDNNKYIDMNTYMYTSILTAMMNAQDVAQFMGTSRGFIAETNNSLQEVYLDKNAKTAYYMSSVLQEAFNNSDGSNHLEKLQDACSSLFKAGKIGIETGALCLLTELFNL